jgi:nicotinamide mononucleotide adenylyltransferase
MRLEIRKIAANTIAATKNWIDNQNTVGAGDRWVAKLFEDLNKRAKSGVKHAICKNETLSKRHYSCFTYNDKWIVAYKIKDETFIVHRFIVGSMLV